MVCIFIFHCVTVQAENFWRGLFTEGNLRFKIDWASRIVGRKFSVYALFYFVFEGSFSKYKSPGGLYLEGRFNGGFFVVRDWGAYIWRGLYMEGLIFGILRLFSGCSGFPSLQKPTFSNSNTIGNGRRITTMWICYLYIFTYLLIFIHLFIYCNLQRLFS